MIGATRPSLRASVDTQNGHGIVSLRQSTGGTLPPPWLRIPVSGKASFREGVDLSCSRGAMIAMHVFSMATLSKRSTVAYKPLPKQTTSGQLPLGSRARLSFNSIVGLKSNLLQLHLWKRRNIADNTPGILSGFSFLSVNILFSTFGLNVWSSTNLKEVLS